MKSAKSGMPIVTSTECEAKYIIDEANRIGVHIVEPVTVTKLVRNREYYREVKYRSGVLVDDIDLVLKQLLGLGCPVNTATLTPDSMKNRNGENSMNSKELTSNLEYNNNICDINFSKVCVEAYSHVLRHMGLNPYTISDIKIIVPDKVVEITFLDGSKEKMVCHKEDTFDLRKCCFIAIAKHLYKDTYTFEGIEYKANELMMQKKYVNIVNDALKDFRAKEREREKVERIEKEKAEAIERRKAKRWKQKERRMQRKAEEEREALMNERKEMVDIIAEAIVKANGGE